jgi:hypothetical protein
MIITKKLKNTIFLSLIYNVRIVRIISLKLLKKSGEENAKEILENFRSNNI